MEASPQDHELNNIIRSSDSANFCGGPEFSENQQVTRLMEKIDVLMRGPRLANLVHSARSWAMPEDIAEETLTRLWWWDRDPSAEAIGTVIASVCRDAGRKVGVRQQYMRDRGAAYVAAHSVSHDDPVQTIVCSELLSVTYGAITAVCARKNGSAALARKVLSYWAGSSFATGPLALSERFDAPESTVQSWLKEVRKEVEASWLKQQA